MTLPPQLHIMEVFHKEPGPTNLTLQTCVVFEVFEIVPVQRQFVSVAIVSGTPYPSSDPKLLSQG